MEGDSVKRGSLITRGRNGGRPGKQPAARQRKREGKKSRRGVQRASVVWLSCMHRYYAKQGSKRTGNSSVYGNNGKKEETKEDALAERNYQRWGLALE